MSTGILVLANNLFTFIFVRHYLNTIFPNGNLLRNGYFTVTDQDNFVIVSFFSYMDKNRLLVTYYTNPTYLPNFFSESYLNVSNFGYGNMLL